MDAFEALAKTLFHLERRGDIDIASGQIQKDDIAKLKRRRDDDPSRRGVAFRDGHDRHRVPDERVETRHDVK